MISFQSALIFDMRTKKTKKGRSKSSKSKNQSKKSLKSVQNQQELVCVPDDGNYVRFEVNGRTHFVNIHDNIPVVEKIARPVSPAPQDIVNVSVDLSATISPLPEPKFHEIDDYEISDAPPRPTGYIRFIEKSAEELDGEVEYDVDEEDTTWLSIMNEKREVAGLSVVQIDVLELLMDRLEKESYFQATATGQTNNVVDDDAVCCICNDGECQNTNVILFCDMCNLAVHQDCYGVPYIPEGQWLCRRCLQSPSRAVNCVMCPNIDGAFKQTDKGEWAHVVCALWIPEVRFANTVFLEPIDSVELIPAARWRLTCYICKRKSVGACIQCHKSNCYSAFHVTCAQYAGLYMKMDTVIKHGAVVRSGSIGSHNESSNDSMKSAANVKSVIVRKIAFCHLHMPAGANDDLAALKKKRDQIAKKAQKSIRNKSQNQCNQGPVIISIPRIPENRIQEIGSLVNMSKKHEFLQRLIAYWTLKRQYRNGVPLLRRLQTQGNNRSSDSKQLYKDVDTVELIRQIRYWQCLRQDLERARLLCELVRKREKLKLEMVRVTEKFFLFQSDPIRASLLKLLQAIAAKDVHDIFQEPVDVEEVPDYLTVVTDPMDLSTMKAKLENGEYSQVEDLETDFELMISNCLIYNSPDTIFYRAGVKMADQCRQLINQSKLLFENYSNLPINMADGDELNNIKIFTEETKSTNCVSNVENAMAEGDTTEKIIADADRMTTDHDLAELEQLLKRCRSIPDIQTRKVLVKRVYSRVVRARSKRFRLNSATATKSSTGRKKGNATEDDDVDMNDPKSRKKSMDLKLQPEFKKGAVGRRTSRKSKSADSTEKTQKSVADKDPQTRLSKKMRSKKCTSPKNKRITSPSNVNEMFTDYRDGDRPHSDAESDATSYSSCYSRTVSDIEKEDEVIYQLPDKTIVVKKRKKPAKATVSKKKKRFPADLIMKEKWMKAIQREGWVPCGNSRLCSRHFDKECYTLSPFQQMVLKKTAVPTIFNLSADDEEATKKDFLKPYVPRSKSDEPKKRSRSKSTSKLNTSLTSEDDELQNDKKSSKKKQTNYESGDASSSDGELPF